MKKPVEHIYVEYGSDNNLEFDMAIAELKQRFGEDAVFLFDIKVYVYPNT
jgi:hypothetical protein